MKSHRLVFNPTLASHMRGVTLMEVLVTVAVTSVGLLGLASLAGVSAKVNENAYQRTQVGFAAQTLIESMHINPHGIAQGKYESVLTEAIDTSPDCRHGPCDVAARARFDLAMFSRNLAENAPNASSSVKCVVQPGASAAVRLDSTCRIEVNWSDRALTENDTVKQQSQVWTFQP